MNARRRRWPAPGFTLVELMVTIAIAAILLMIAAPSFTGFQRNSELTSTVNSLVAGIGAARGEAMKRGMRVYVVPADAANWSSGWVVFVDQNADGAYTEGTDIAVLKQGPLPAYFTTTGTGTANAAPPYILFDPSGYPKTTGGGFGPITLSIARNDVTGAAVFDQTRRLVIASAGRVRTCRPASATDNQCLANATS